MSKSSPPRGWSVGVVLVVTCLWPLRPTSLAAAETVTLTPVKDNTLIENGTGAVSAATSFAVFAGRVTMGGSTLRRGIIQFDVGSVVPPSATVTSVTLDLTCVLSNTGVQSVSLHHALEAWGEGTSFGIGPAGGVATPSDATWLHTFWPDAFWSTAGGSFVATPSATAIVDAPGNYQWASTPALIADVQSWLDEPLTNNGWVIVGNESVAQTVKGFASREASERQRPLLTIEYTAEPADINGDTVVDGADLALLLSSWGPCDAPPVSCAGDIDGSGTVEGSDLSMMLAAWTT